MSLRGREGSGENHHFHGGPGQHSHVLRRAQDPRQGGHWSGLRLPISGVLCYLGPTGAWCV